MPQYRKRPVVIEARQLTGGDIGGISDWLGSAFAGWDIQGVYIATLEGTMRANVGDWIIQGVKGEFYPCKDDIFQQTYELVEG